MSERVLPLQANVHRMVDALLPWYVNGTLSRDEQDLVSRHLRDCAPCRREVEWLRELHAACAACAAEEGAGSVLSTLGRRRARPWLSAATWRIAAVAQLGIIAVLAWQLRVAGDGTAAVYRTLAAPSPTAGANVVVVFDGATSERQMRELLQSIGGRIVGGPTPAEGYLIAVPAVSQARALEALRGARIVKLAEPIGPTVPR